MVSLELHSTLAKHHKRILPGVDEQQGKVALTSNHTIPTDFREELDLSVLVGVVLWLRGAKEA